MKIAIKFWSVVLIFMLVSSIALVSCKAKQNLESTTVETTNKETLIDDKEKIVINQEIIDKMLFEIEQIRSSNPDCDSLINAYREELAIKLNGFKQSGDNSYELKYNKALKRIELLMKVGKTEKKEKVKNTTTKTDYNITKTIQVPVHYMHWWETLFMRIGQICSGLAVLFLGFVIFKNKIV